MTFDFFDFCERGENLCLTVVNGDGVLEMGCGTPVACDHAPAVFLQRYLGTTESSHRLNGDAEAILELLACTLASVVGHLRGLVHLAAYAVADKFSYNTITMTLAMLLNGCTDVAKTAANDAGFNGLVERLLGHAE